MSDLISRQAAIEAIERNAYRHTYLDQIINIISNLPSAEVTLCHLDSPCEYQNAGIAMPSAQQWIPVSERLPEAATDVLVCNDDQKQTIDPVKRGKWIDRRSIAAMNRYECSVCKRMTTVDEFMGKPMYAYCPWCGAELKGEE